MANPHHQSPKVHRLPYPYYVDFIRFLPSQSPFHKSLLLSTFHPLTHTSTLLSLTLSPSSSPTLLPSLSWTPPSRLSSLSTPSPSSLFAASSLSGSLHVFSPSGSSSSLDPVFSFGPGPEFHVGPVSGVDLIEGGVECVCVGEDGRVNLVDVGNGGGGFRRVFDGNGLVSYSAVKWASGAEFVAGGVGFGLQYWDTRRPGGPVALLKGNWDKKTSSGIIHSLDIHPSRKHTCLAGGSSGTVFAWDLRRQHQPIVLSSKGSGHTMTHSLSESEVWEVRFDPYTRSSGSHISSSQILPAMICSEDGILAVIDEGEEPTELLAEPCAINSFDIDRQNPSDVICSLEWESIAIVSRR